MKTVLRSTVAGLFVLAAMPGLTVAGEKHGGRSNFYYHSDRNQLPSHIRGLGTFAGINAFRDRGNGIYFSTRGHGRVHYWEPRLRRPRKPSVITVNPQTVNRACAWEYGVCVIRN